MTIRLENAPELEGVLLPAGTAPLQGKTGFGQLLDTLTHPPADAPVSGEGSPCQQDELPLQMTDKQTSDGVALLVAFMSGISISSPAGTPALLEGGRSAAGEQGYPLPPAPPPLPQLPQPPNNPSAPAVSNPNMYAQHIDFLNDNQENELKMQLMALIDATLWQEPVNKNPVGEATSPASPLLESEHLTALHRDKPMMTGQQVEPVQHRELSLAPHEHSAPFPALLQPLHHATGGFSLQESTAISDSPIYQQVADVLERLVMHREERTIHLQLDPPELGTLQIRIHVEGSEVHAWLAAERDLTRQSLEQQAQQLREQLAARGLQLAHFEVSTGSQGAFGGRWFDLPSSLPSPETPSRRVHATDSLNLFGQWSAWA